MSFKQITKEELKEKLNDRNVVIVNVLKEESYDNLHIKGSVNIPRSELENSRWNELDKNKEIITHCTNYACNSSRYAAEFLQSKGFNVKAYEGGIEEWKEAGYPVEGKSTN